MKARWIIAVALLIPATGAGYMTWLSWMAGEDNKWFFGVIAGFFLLMAAAPFLPAGKSKPKPEPEPSPNTRFVPHWFMLLAVLVLVLSIILAIVGAVLRH